MISVKLKQNRKLPVLAVYFSARLHNSVLIGVNVANSTICWSFCDYVDNPLGQDLFQAHICPL